MSVQACTTACQKTGYLLAGVECAKDCWCDNATSNGATFAPNGLTACNLLCKGNSSEFCGGHMALDVYKFQSSVPLLPFDAAVSPSSSKVSSTSRTSSRSTSSTAHWSSSSTLKSSSASSEPYGTGAYELDLTQIGNFSAAWRTMTGMQTDVFCSAGLTLPDKAGRQITIGGWAGASNFGVRLYWPDGSDGVPETNEWEEDPDVLSLQVPRWYASAMIMANGSMLIVGGEIGSNAAQQPTLEILPATGVPDSTTVSGYSNTTVYLDFLDRTAPFNLYPFICVVPSGIFIAYYNEARILDEHTFQTIKTLPNMPGAVNDPTGGRTYQIEGTMALLPQHAPYTADLEVLICGGSTAGGGYALDNCITTAPEDPEPIWTIERMPSRRVMPCIAGLPDGTYLILNGGQHGATGFGLGGSQNLNACFTTRANHITPA
ncbi:hypothetical protein EG329_012591 [Mollisiaceae sp. DMI_Dod_QoI]|nr:hypothetical protein EG329_012591 [Helotiales sp. DMI_Dod_QoI]